MKFECHFIGLGFRVKHAPCQLQIVHGRNSVTVAACHSKGYPRRSSSSRPFTAPLHPFLIRVFLFLRYSGSLPTIAETSDCESASANKSRNIIILRTSSENTKSPRRHRSVIYCVLSAWTAHRVTARPHERIALLYQLFNISGGRFTIYIKS